MNAIAPIPILSLVPLAAIFMPSFVADPAAAETLPLIRESNLRSAPQIDSKILSVLAKGTRVDVGGCRDDGWCRASWNGRHGYIIARNLSGTAAPQPALSILPSRDNDPGPWRKAGGGEKGSTEHSFILEIGAAGEWPLDAERPNFGGTIAGEVEPIENWLELEFGYTTLATAGRTEISGDLLFKKPFRLSPAVEFMAGLGPSLAHTSGPDQGSSWSAEFALDWMFWPTKNLGWYIEPTWSVNPKNGQQSVAVSLGLLIGFPK